MHPLLADLVHRVLRRGLDLKERLADGRQLDLDVEQAILKDLLLAATETGRIPDYGPDRARSRGSLALSDGKAGNNSQADFLGVRYALVCWLDELFTLDDTDWSARWNEQKLEVELYGSNDRAWRFWQQANLAQARTSDDALEAFFLCVMLGFRGELRGQDDRLLAWIGSARRRLGQIDQIAWSYASQLNAPLPARPLSGRRLLRTSIMTAMLTAVAVVPCLVFLVIWKIGK